MTLQLAPVRRRLLYSAMMMLLVYVFITGCSHISLPSHDSEEGIISNFTRAEIQAKCDAAIVNLQRRLKDEAKDAYHFDRIMMDFSDAVEPLNFLGYVHTDKDVRGEANQCEEKSNKARVDVYTRRDLYDAVRATVATTQAQKRLVSELRLEFERNGLKLSDAKLAKVKLLKMQLAELESQFAKNLNEDVSTVSFSPAELDGVSSDFLIRLKKNEKGELIVTTKSTDYNQVMDNAKNPNTRHKMLKAYESRAANDNMKLLEKAVVLREQIAQLLGYKTWADYNIHDQMAKTGSAVLAFLNNLKHQLHPKLKSDFAGMLRAKREMEDPNASSLKAWDLRYFQNQLKKRDYALDEEVIREYFPKDHVMQGVFQIYSTLLGVHYQEVYGARVWSPEVKLYKIIDDKTQHVIAYFYTDFIPREGKYGHAAAFPLIAGREVSLGQYSLPVAAIVANFTPATAQRPSLLTHDEVETLFHEFGHIMHQTLTRAPYGSLSGTRTRRDFVEAPSQMLQNWVWDPQMLGRISSHYQTKKPLPLDLVQKMIATKHFGDGYFYSRQLMLGLFDIRMHTAKSAVAVNPLYRSTYQEVMTIPAVDDSAFPAGFGHMMGGYDAGYYGYLWSKVFAEDMFTVFQSAGLLDSTSGHRYREIILESGNMLDPAVLIEKFIGRKSNNKAFLRSIGL